MLGHCIKGKEDFPLTLHIVLGCITAQGQHSVCLKNYFDEFYILEEQS